MDDKRVIVKDSNGEVKEFQGLAALQSSPEFEAILERAAQDKILSVDYRALVFIDKLNLRALRPDDGGMVRRSAAINDMKLDHSNSQDARIGFVSDLADVKVMDEGQERSGVSALMQVRSGKHQVQFLKGMVDKYSVGIGGTGAKCSACSAKYHNSGPKGDLSFYPSCGHWPGDAQDNKTVEMLILGSRIKEVSLTGKPAVTGVKNYVGNSLSADGDAEIRTELESTMTEKELQDRIKALESDLAAQKEVAEKATKFATELAGEVLVKDLRVTKAELKGDRVQKLVTVLGVEDAFELIKQWPPRPELSAKNTLSADTGETVDSNLSADESDEAVDTVLSAVKQPKRVGKPETKPAPKTLFERLKERGDIKVKEAK